MEKPIETMSLKEVMGELKSYNITQTEIDKLVSRVQKLAEDAHIARSQPLEGLSLPPWANNGNDCLLRFEDDGSYAIWLHHQNGHECSRYLNKGDAEAMIDWLTRALERME